MNKLTHLTKLLSMWYTWTFSRLKIDLYDACIAAVLEGFLVSSLIK